MAVTKGSIATIAIKQLRLYGVILAVDPEDNQTVLEVLELVAGNFANKNLHLGFKFCDPEVKPSADDDSGIIPEHRMAFALKTAVLASSALGAVATNELKSAAQDAYRMLFSTKPPTRAPNKLMPMGEGNRGYKYQPEPPEELTTKDGDSIDDIEI